MRCAEKSDGTSGRGQFGGGAGGAMDDKLGMLFLRPVVCCGNADRRRVGCLSCSVLLTEGDLDAGTAIRLALGPPALGMPVLGAC